jgi:16S rRNA (cytosine967-C5)-methyltransferase
MDSKRKYNVREMALHVLHEAETKMVFSDRLLERTLYKSRLDKRDRDFMTMLVKGTLRRQGSIDWVLNKYVGGGVDSLPAWTRVALRIGAFQILYMDRVPASAATNESVTLARKYCGRSMAGLTNAVLRRTAHDKDEIKFPEPGEDKDMDPAEAIAIKHSHPRWMVERWVERFGAEEAAALCAANNDVAHVDIRVNTLRATPQRVADALEEQKLTVERGKYNRQILRVSGEISVINMEGFKQGHFTVQDESESLVGSLLAPQPGETVVDLCAAPGGKSSHLYELMKATGMMLASDVSPGRIRSLTAALHRMKYDGIHVIVADGRRFPSRAQFDKVLVDAPCSGMGVLGKKADARWRKNPDAFERLSGLQLEILNAAADLVADGGALVYSVCSMEPEETDDVVERFLERRPDLVIDSAAGLLHEDVSTEEGTMRTFPHVHGVDGAFAARFRRR